MSTDNAQPSDTVTATVDLTIAGRHGRLEVAVPTRAMRVVELLPLLQSLADTLVNVAVENAEADGSRVSCRKGCGACCRQLVPIAEIEVESIRRVVRKLPDAQRTAVIQRFDDARRRLESAGLLEPLRAPKSLARDDLAPLGDAYFAQGIACPFLVDESCSIHADRPLSCREYLVVSPAANCERPTPSTIQCVKVPLRVSNVVRHVAPEIEAASAPWVPLILALDWPIPGPVSDAEHTGTAMMARLFTHLLGQDVREPEAPPAAPSSS